MIWAYTAQAALAVPPPPNLLACLEASVQGAILLGSVSRVYYAYCFFQFCLCFVLSSLFSLPPPPYPFYPN